MNTVEYLRVYPYQWWTSPRCDPSLPARKELLVALPCLTVNGSNQFVLHLDDGIGGFGTRGMQEAQDNGNSLG